MQCTQSAKAIVVIVVEDDPMVRMAAVAAFEDAGFEVLEGRNAAAAMSIFKDQGGRVQALFTDVEMPGAMNGLMLARQVHADFPDICVIVASGQINPGEGEMPDNSRFFRKPYNLENVVAHIRERALPV